MRGRDRQSGKLFSYVSPEALVPPDHPLRAIKRLVDAALDRLSADFAMMYAATGRPSIPPEKLLRALLLQAFFTVRSERQLMQQITYNMLFRWFLGLAMDAPVWDVTVFTKNRDRLMEGDIARRFLATLLADPQVVPLLSSEHFSVDGTLIEAWAELAKVPPAKQVESQRRAASRASARRTAAASRPRQAATVNATFTARSGATRRTPRPPIPTLGCSANRPASPRNSATWDTC
jgi:transposase